MEVFAYIVPTSCRALNLLHVCRKWRYVAIKTPEFWSDLLRIPAVTRAAVRGDPNGIDRFRTFLRRSAPIRIAFNASCLPLHVSEVIGAHLNQIGGLKVRVGGDEAVALCSWLREGMPVLQELEIFHKATCPLEPADRNVFHSLTCSDAALPRLRTLRVSPAFFGPGLAVQSLHTLHIGGCSCDDCRGDAKAYTLEDLFSFLKRSPSLSSIKFSLGSEPLHWPAGSSPVQPIALSALKNLTFEHYQVDSLRDMLSNLIIPPTAIVRVTSENFTQEGGPYFPSSLRKLPLPWDLRSLRVVVSSCSCDLLGANLRTEAGRIKIGWKTLGVLGRRTELFREFAQLFASPAVSRLHISVASNLYPTCLDRARMAALLGAFPQLTFLRVGRKCHDLFRYLAQAEEGAKSSAGGDKAGSGSGEARGVPCRHLDHLIALWSVSWEEEFRTSCDLVEKTLAQRAALGSRLSILDLRFRRLYGLKPGQGEVDLEEIRSGLVRRLRPLAGMVVVTIEM
ncbi:hypothetical protein GSI_09299 [Ganoderma sinense ZZ0214-1]|uniref:F-box domain-containing protein n=1 Tax=Ganoderma sinense ZZ0214-1 TaxID=1077348 RepID=A0A2G8S648_9APHY|nr:hypothetical protein GSI_09299 [Ganoderma sinense ZZ0214-1]